MDARIHGWLDKTAKLTIIANLDQPAGSNSRRIDREGDLRVRKLVGSIATAAILMAAGAAWAAAAPSPLEISQGPGDWWELDFGRGYKQYGMKMEDTSELQVHPAKGAAATSLAGAMKVPDGTPILAYTFVGAPFLTRPLCADVPANWVAVAYPAGGTPVFAAINWASPGDTDHTICNLQPMQANNPEA